jgi:hypothetical protein
VYLWCTPLCKKTSGSRLQALASYDPRRLHGVTLYRETERAFSEGDRVQFTAPNRERHWRVNAANIACTKIASKLIDPSRSEGHTLASLLLQYLSITLDKTKRKSDWLSWALFDSRLVYAGNDVIHLPELLSVLMRELETRNLGDLAKRCFAHIPTQVQLDIGGLWVLTDTRAVRTSTP